MTLLVPGVEGHRHEKFSGSPASLPATNFKVQNIWNNLEGVVGCQKCQNLYPGFPRREGSG